MSGELVHIINIYLSWNIFQNSKTTNRDLPVTWFNPLEAAGIRIASVRRSARSETEPKHRATKLLEGNVLFREGKGRKGKEGLGKGKEEGRKGTRKEEGRKGTRKEKGRKGTRKEREGKTKGDEWKGKEKEGKVMGEGGKGRKRKRRKKGRGKERKREGKTVTSYNILLHFYGSLWYSTDDRPRSRWDQNTRGGNLN